MDIHDIKDLIVGIIVIGSMVWGFVVQPIKEYLKKQAQLRSRGRGSRQNLSPGHRAQSAAPARRSAPAPQKARSDGGFRPWKGSPSPAQNTLAVETGVSPFISGEEGVRATVDADSGTDAEMAPTSTEPAYGSELLGDSAEDLRRGVIWAEVLKPKFKD